MNGGVNMDKIIFTVSEVAEILRVNKVFVYDLIKARRLRAVKIGSTKIYKKDLLEFIENNAEVV